MKLNNPLILAVILFLGLVSLANLSYAQGFNIEDSFKVDEEKETIPEHSFFDICMEFPDPTISEDSHVASCACMDAKMSAVIQEKEDAADLGTDFFDTSQPKAETKISNKEMLAEIHTPCLYVSAKDRAYNECTRNAANFRFIETEKMLKNFCNCIGFGAEDYLEKNAYNLLAPILYKKNTSSDLFDVLDETMEYRRSMADIKADCFGKHTGHVINNTKPTR